jgi:L-rhamnose isomerase
MILKTNIMGTLFVFILIVGFILIESIKYLKIMKMKKFKIILTHPSWKTKTLREEFAQCKNLAEVRNQFNQLIEFYASVHNCTYELKTYSLKIILHDKDILLYSCELTIMLPAENGNIFFI